MHASTPILSCIHRHGLIRWSQILEMLYICVVPRVEHLAGKTEKLNFFILLYFKFK